MNIFWIISMQLGSPRLETTNADWLVILQVLLASISHSSSPSCIFTIITDDDRANGKTNAWGILRRGKSGPDCKTSALRQSAIRKGKYMLQRKKIKQTCRKKICSYKRSCDENYIWRNYLWLRPCTLWPQ